MNANGTNGKNRLDQTNQMSSTPSGTHQAPQLPALTPEQTTLLLQQQMMQTMACMPMASFALNAAQMMATLTNDFIRSAQAAGYKAHCHFEVRIEDE